MARTKFIAIIIVDPYESIVFPDESIKNPVRNVANRLKR